MSQNRFWNLLAKKLSGEAIPTEMAELDQLIRENPEWVYAAEHIQDLWNLTSKETISYDAEIAFDLHLNRQLKNGMEFPELQTPLTVDKILEKEKPSRKKKVLKFSVLGLLLVIAGFLWYYFTSSAQSIVKGKAYSEVSTQPGSKTSIVLPDSTIVWLNAGSKLTYNDQFGITNRNTTLTGEAYFDVRKSNVPFVIHTNGIQIKVLGTEFNVKSYPDETVTETSLIRGSIEVTIDKRPGEKFILQPNEKLIVNNSEEIKTPTKGKRAEPIIELKELNYANDVIIETSWVNNKLVFQDESFADLAKKMERWYGFTFEFRNEKISRERLSGTFTNENIHEALVLLQMTTPFSFNIKSNSIIITE